MIYNSDLKLKISRGGEKPRKFLQKAILGIFES